MFSQPANTGANMTVGVNASKFDQFEGGQIGAFIDLNGNGVYDADTLFTADGKAYFECVGLETIIPGFFGLALWGDDSSTPVADGLLSGAQPQFALLFDGNVILVSEIPQFTGYVTNGIVNITDALLSMDGCDNPSACNYNPEPPSDVIIIDACEGFVGCTDDSYDEFNVNATCDPDSACQTLIVPGCMDSNFCNFNADANVDDGSCLGYYGCTDPGYLEYDSGASCDDATCADLIVLGCTDMSAYNYNSEANLDDGSCYPFIYGCTDDTMFNFIALTGDVQVDVNTDDG
jgi:hypothetical protein